MKNKRCLVTGGTRGIGKEIATLLKQEGCEVFAAGTKHGDLSNYQGVLWLIEHIKESLENIDILINCAGTYLKKPILDCNYKDFDKIFNINIKAPWLLCKEFIPYMKKNKWGRIVNFGSIASYHGHSNQSLYNASKHALLGMSRSLVKELNDDNIRVMCVSPSGTATDMGKACKGNQDINTFLDPKEIAEHVVFNLKFDKQLVNTEIRLNRMFINPNEKIM